jgi:hypothetical protein
LADHGRKRALLDVVALTRTCDSDEVSFAIDHASVNSMAGAALSVQHEAVTLDDVDEIPKLHRPTPAPD